ncbi:MAG: hypothetical protein ACR652_17770 [Methylocystis sp.]|uniref:hypothetical protein n=1 Tax=Methylocystis sp. TaxID=1911079 RepID=UPI003DA29550
MLDLPDHGYVDLSISGIDPGGNTEGILGGTTNTLDRPGYRYSIQFTLPELATEKDARIFQAMLEQGSREDVSYPWPLDVKAVPAGTPVVDGASPAGAVIPIRGLVADYQFKLGQPLAVITVDPVTGETMRFIHKAKAAQAADATGAIVLEVFPITRKAFLDGDTIEVEKPRIGGALTWDGGRQGAYGARPFTFSITER